LDCLTLEDGNSRLSRNVGNYQITLHKTPEERIPNLHGGARLKSRKFQN
jgi:hypothetical protein